MLDTPINCNIEGTMINLKGQNGLNDHKEIKMRNLTFLRNHIVSTANFSAARTLAGHCAGDHDKTEHDKTKTDT